METVYDQFHKPGIPGTYYGERPDWLVFYGQTRDSEALTRSNFECLTNQLRDMCGEEGEQWAIEHFTHWAVGWIESILINPKGQAVAWAEHWLSALSNYPVVDDDHLSDLEWDETYEYIQSVGWDGLSDWERREYEYMKDLFIDDASI